jgi:hypothetical protein
MAAFTYLVDDVGSLIIYLILGAGCATFLKLNKCLIMSVFLLYVGFAIVAQLADAEWFYHDMPDKITAFYLLMSSVRAFILIVPICCGVGISWLIHRHMIKPTSN